MQWSADEKDDDGWEPMPPATELYRVEVPGLKQVAERIKTAWERQWLGRKGPLDS